ncbi:trans-sialidase [Trypanosoma cruzi]|nr:trans-sialidase [Trypanosoma cruzi]
MDSCPAATRAEVFLSLYMHRRRILRLCGVMLWGETTVKRLAAACVGVSRCVLTRDEYHTRCGFYCWWWKLLCVPGALFIHLLLRVSVCISVVVVGNDCVGDDDATHCGGAAVLTVSLLFPLLSLSHTQ